MQVIIATSKIWFERASFRFEGGKELGRWVGQRLVCGNVTLKGRDFDILVQKMGFVILLSIFISMSRRGGAFNGNFSFESCRVF